MQYRPASLCSTTPAKIKFRMPRSLDKLFLYGRAAPSHELDIVNNQVGFRIGNNHGIVYVTPSLWGYQMDWNKSMTKCVIHQQATGAPMVRMLMIRKFMNHTTGLYEYFFKIKLEADLQAANPVGSVYTEEDLRQMFSMFVVGDAPFYINAAWERRSYGWYLSDMTMSTWYRTTKRRGTALAPCPNRAGRGADASENRA